MKKNGGLKVLTATEKPPAVLNLVRRGDAEVATRVAYATGRRDAMLVLAVEMAAIAGQVIAVDDLIEAVKAAAAEFDVEVERIKKGEPPAETSEETAARKARERLVLPS